MRRAVLAVSLLTAAAACSLVVSSTPPPFRCVPGPGTCPAGFTCLARTGQCVSLADGGEGGAGCTATGCPCSGGGDCASGTCGGELSVTTDVYTAAGKANFCTQPCCTSHDCDSSSVCFATGGGGSYCVPPAWIGRGSRLGMALGGDACTGDADCRSGVCASGTCADSCCSTSQAATECGSGAACRFGAFPGVGFDVHEAAFCGPMGGSGATGTRCTSGADCRGGLCDSLTSVCRDACRGAGDCGTGVMCSYALVATPATPQVVAACTAAGGGATQGTPCKGGSDCVTGLCSPVSHACTDPCFADSDCTQVEWRCRPETVQFGGSYSVLYCGP